MGSFESLLGRNGLLPHGYCFQWSPRLLWSSAGADTLIALAYFSIPLAILSYVRRRPQLALGHLPWLFAAFITACGITHVFHVWTIWRPDYELHAAAKVVTAAVSVFTAVTLWRLMPAMLAIPTVQQLEGAVAALRDEVARRRSAEELLADVEQALATTLATTGAAFLATDREGRVTRMNAVAEAVTGWSQQEALGRPVWQVLRREGRPPEVEQRNPLDVLRESGFDARHMQSGICVARDGTRTPIELSAELAHQPDGTLRGMNIVFRDTTRLTRAEADTRRLAAVVATSTDAIVAKRLDGTITSWNAAAERLFGWRADEIIGQPVQWLIPPERETEEMGILTDLAAGRVRPPFDTVRLAKDGRRVEVQASISPLLDDLGHVVGGSSVVRDLTHQRSIEQALRANEQRLRFALDAAHLGDWELDIDTGLLLGSARFARCFGHAEPLAGWGLGELAAAMHPDDRAHAMGLLQQALTQRQVWHAEFRVVWADGSEHWLRLSGRVREEPGQSPRMTGIAGDITAVRSADEARQTAERLSEENVRIQESSRLKSLFLANMSHELRTPLNAVIGFADLLRSGAVAADSAKHGEYLGHIANSGRHLLQLINDVLDLSKVEAGKIEFRAGPVDLQALIDQVVAVLGAEAAAKPITLLARVEPGLHDLRLDTARLRQVMFNYLSNAIKFTPAGGRVELRAMAEGPRHFRFEVQDSGIGISEADQQRLFVEFQQLESGFDRRHQGTGLGLALTRRLVQAQGGRVGVHSRPGQGSLFYAVLPRRPAETPLPPETRLLVAQADPQLREQITLGAADAGVRADVASSVAEVLQLMRTTRYDAVALDLLLRDGQPLGALAPQQQGSAGSAVRSISLRAGDAGTAAFAINGLLGKPLQGGELDRALAPLRPALGSGRVLVVDDEALARELMLGALAALGVPAVAVAGGEEALARLDELAPTVMVLDLMMPGLDGFQVLHRLRQQMRWRALPVLVWTAASLADGELALLRQSAQAIVAKGGGGGVGELLDALLRWLALQPPREQAS
jgi:PAS domain S-box-containing protein